MQMEREEGELSDEDLEDVSDNSSLSITPFVISGKSLPLSTNREPFRELSLTSVSDDSVENESLLEKNSTSYRLLSTRAAREFNRNICRRHCRYRREVNDYNTSPKKTRRISERPETRNRITSRKQYSSVSSSSSESESYVPDGKILRQLRDAVRISSSRSLPNCSLRTRLKRMIEPDSQGSKCSNSEDDVELEALRDQALQSKIKNDSSVDSAKDSITDEDLINLRLIALKSAMMKKHQNRRKRKEEQNKLLEQVTTNREQQKTDVTSSCVSNGQKQESEYVVSNVPSIDVEPETDNMKQGITQEIVANTVIIENDNNNKNIDEDEDILRAMLLTSISKKIASKKQQELGIQENNNSLKQTLPIPNNSTIVPPMIRVAERNALRMPVIPINRFVINVNSDSESDAEQTMNAKKNAISNVKSNDLFDKSLALFLQQARAKSETEHQSDIAKHLPRSQQLEYKRLKRKLQQLSSKLKPITKSKRTADVLDENKRLKLTNVNYKRNFSRTKSVPCPPLTNTRPVVILKQTECVNVAENIGDISEKQLNNAGGRLQVKGKYEELMPLMTRVSEAQNARDRAQDQVKQLINDLRIARVALTSSHQTYSVLMHQLVKSKTIIDNRLNDQEQRNNTKTNKTPIFTSTPNKPDSQDISSEQSRINENVGQQVEVQTIEVNADIHRGQEVDETSEKDTEQVMEIHIVQPMDIVEEEDDDDDQETVIQTDLKSDNPGDILTYTSPLDHMQLNRETAPGDPLVVLCPYDLLGECRDPDCSYRHCKNANAH